MESSKKRIRVSYAPLNVAVSLYCLSTGSPATQVYNAGNSEFEPDRELTPTVLFPEITATASDGSWDEPYVNPMLSDMAWYVNGVDISTISEWQGKYEIDTTDSMSRGSITIKRNVNPGERYAFSFRGTIADDRLGTLIPVRTDEIILSTTEKAGDSWSLSLGDSSIVKYDLFMDRLALYEYKTSHGLQEESETAEQDATDANSYLREIPITVYNGPAAVTSGYTVELLRDGSPVSAGGEVQSIATDHVTLDLRLITEAGYVVRIKADGREVARANIAVAREYPKYTCNPTNGTDIAPGDTQRYDKANVMCRGNIVECPESIVKITWKTDTSARTNVTHNEGGETVFMLDDTGIGSSYNDSWLDVYTDSEQKGAHSIAVDEGGNTLTDEDGNVFIFN